MTAGSGGTKEERARMKKRATVPLLLGGQAVNGFGDGLWFSIWAIYFTRIQHIPAESMGLAIGIGGVAGFLAAIPVGTAADRRGPREVLFLIVLLRGTASAAYIFVDGFWSLLLVSCCYSAVQSSGVGVRVSLVYQLMDKDNSLRVLAQGRVVQHIAYAAGAGAAMLVLADGGRSVFVASILVNAVTFAVAAVLTLALPHVPATPVERRQKGTAVLRDLPYVGLMSTTALLSLCWPLLSSGLPLWIAEGTEAPLWTAGLAVAVSSLAIALFQVRVTRQAVDIPRSVRSNRISALALACCCLVFAAAAWAGSPLLATLVIVLGMGAHVVGELFYVSSRWGLSLGFMVKEAEGQYQGLTASTESGATALGPALVTALVSGAREAGWLVLGALLLLSTVPVGALSRRAERDPRRVTWTDERTTERKAAC
ncbi:MFS transporter [Streptomyces sp. NPDC000963]